MRFAILADIHANWPALEMVLEDIVEQGEVHMTYCLGDLVGYYTFPGECLEALMGLERFFAIRGNHDRYLLGQVKHRVKPATLEIIEFTRQQISAEQYEWVEQMQDKRKIRDHFLLVHGSPRNKDEYMTGPERNAKNLVKMQQVYPDYDLCFFGHTHKPVVVADNEVRQQFQRDVSIKLDQGKTYLVNPGSVGQPRDGCPLASYLIYDAAERVLHFRRVDYPYEETQKAVLEQGFEQKLADRLAVGK